MFKRLIDYLVEEAKKAVLAWFEEQLAAHVAQAQAPVPSPAPAEAPAE